MLTLLRYSLFIVLLISHSIFAYAEQKEIFDGPDGSEYEVHYMALVSTFLEPEIAKQYQLVRSKALGLINISVIKIDKDGTRKAVGAVVETRMNNDIQQQQFLSFKQIVEGPSIYYIAQFQFSESELLTFNITVYGEGSIKPMSIRFSQNFYND